MTRCPNESGKTTDANQWQHANHNATRCRQDLMSQRQAEGYKTSSRQVLSPEKSSKKHQAVYDRNWGDGGESVTSGAYKFWSSQQWLSQKTRFQGLIPQRVSPPNHGNTFPIQETPKRRKKRRPKPWLWRTRKSPRRPKTWKTWRNLEHRWRIGESSTDVVGELFPGCGSFQDVKKNCRVIFHHDSTRMCYRRIPH